MPAIVPILIGTVFFAFGLIMALSDPKRLLEYDRRTGYAIYSRIKERGGSEEEALAAARRFYRLFGLIFATIGLVACGVDAAMLIAH